MGWIRETTAAMRDRWTGQAHFGSLPSHGDVNAGTHYPTYQQQEAGDLDVSELNRWANGEPAVTEEEATRHYEWTQQEGREQDAERRAEQREIAELKDALGFGPAVREEPIPYALTPEGEHEADYADVKDRNAQLEKTWNDPLPGEPGYVESPAETEWLAAPQSPTSRELDAENEEAREDADYDAEAAEYEFPDEETTTPARDAYVEMAEADAINPGEYSHEAIVEARLKADAESRSRMAAEREEAIVRGTGPGVDRGWGADTQREAGD